MIQLAVMTRLRKPSANDNDDKAAPPGVPALIRTESRADRANQRRFQRGVDGAMAGAMLVVCIFHSSVCAAVIDFFNCDPPTGENGYEAGAYTRSRQS